MKKLLFLLLLFSGPLFGQSLLQDATKLASASQALSDTTLNEQALGELIAILWFYNENRRNLTKVPKAEAVLKAYQNNNTINALIGNIKVPEGGLSSTFRRSFQATTDSLAAGPRNQILKLLYAEQATDPAEYLSLLKTMQEFQEPPLDAMASLRASATATRDSPSPAGVGLFNEAAIIRGLFSFLIERAGEELVVTFLDRLLGKEMPTVAKLFPTVLTLYGTTDYAYSDAFLANLRDAFLEDLQLLDIRLPELLLTDDLFAELQADPVFYSILTVYSVVAITRTGEVPIEETVPLVTRNLYKRYEDTQKQRNLLLADTAYRTAEYQAVIRAVEKVVQQCQAIYADIEVAETSMNERLDDFLNNPDIPFSLRRETSQLAELTAANSNRFANIFKAKGEDSYDLGFLPSLLSGSLPQSLVSTMGTLESYDKYFDQPVSPQNRRAAGLALARRLTGEEFGTKTIDAYFLEWRDNLIVYEDNLQKAFLAANSDSDIIDQRKAKLLQSTLVLQSALQTARSQWKSLLNTDEANALLVLENIVKNRGQNLPGTTLDELEKVKAEEAEIAAIKDRLTNLHERMVQRLGANTLNPDPIAAFLNTSIDNVPLQSIQDKSRQLGADLVTLRSTLRALDNKYARNLSRSHRNTLPLLQTGEVMSHLFYLLRSDAPDSSAQHFVDLKQVQSLLLDQNLRSAFLGLMEQNLGHLQQVGIFSTEGLATLVQSTTQDLQLLPTRLNEVPDSLRFYQKSAFVVNTINRILETPLLVNPIEPDLVYPLSQNWKGLAEVPEISRNVLDLVFYVSTKNYRQAISKTLETTVRLTETFENTTEDNSTNQQKNLVYFLQQYGGFIGGLVDADSASQVQALLSAFADPPGSSRLKRQRPFTAGINGNVGGLVGREMLSGNAEAPEQSFYTLAPSIPIGVSFSFLLGKRYKEHPPSMSVFFSVLDLGSLATFNLGEEELAGENQLTFRNVLKPGIQLQYNIPKSPFFLGTGYQFGPHFREFNGELLEQRSQRFFVSFGIDISVKRFY